MLAWKKMLKQKTALLAIFGLALLYQDCSNVHLNAKVEQLSIPSENRVTGIICKQTDSSFDSTYSISDFYILNLTARKYRGVIRPDSNLNGTIDLLEDSSVHNPTVTISNLDSDSDGIPDFIEILKGTNPFVDDANQDGIDLDGVVNKREIQLGTDPEDADSQQPELQYNISQIPSASGCGAGQPAYQFNLTRFPVVMTQDFIDSVNPPATSLSHFRDENVLMIVARMSPAATKLGDIYMSKIIKIPVSSGYSNSFLPKDFFVIGEATPTCPLCLTQSPNTYFKVATGAHHSCAISTDHHLNCWGSNIYGQLGNDNFDSKLVLTRSSAIAVSVQDVALGQSHTCVLSTVGDVYCFGRNNYGQLGSGTFADSSKPVKVELGGIATQISSGDNHVCAVVSNNQVKCWGENSNKQLGIVGSDSSIPVTTVTLATGRSVTSLSSAIDYNCLATDLGSGYCWGNGANYAAIPFSYPSTGHAWKQISTNGTVTTGIDKSLTTPPLQVVCWNNSGIVSTANFTNGCGLLDETPDSTVDFTQTINRIDKISMGFDHSCAIHKTAASNLNFLDCWGGNNILGQLGYDSSGQGDPTVLATPTTVDSISEPIDVSAGKYYTCAIDKTGAIWCWGINSYGQLGIGNIVNTIVPTKVMGQ